MVTICTARFNIQQFYILLTQCINVFFVDLRKKTAIISLHSITSAVQYQYSNAVPFTLVSGPVSVSTTVTLPEEPPLPLLRSSQASTG